MPKREVTFDTVQKVGLTLPGVKAYAAALKADGKLLAWIPQNKDCEPDSLCVRMDPEDRDELIAADPEVYYVTGHYLNSSTVLVRLGRVRMDALKDLLGMGLKFVSRKPPSKSVTKKRA